MYSSDWACVKRKLRHLSRSRRLECSLGDLGCPYFVSQRVARTNRNEVTVFRMKTSLRVVCKEILKKAKCCYTVLKTALTFNIFIAIHLFMGYFQFLKNPTFKTSLSAKTEKMSFICMRIKNHFLSIADCKTVRISAYSSKREQSNKGLQRGWKQTARLGSQ